MAEPSKILDELKLYALPGTNLCVYAQCWNVPKGYIAMSEDRPSEEHIAEESGNWILPQDKPLEAENTIINNKRRKAILEEFPVHEQLEAFCDYISGDETKMTVLLSGIDKIRERYPKNN